MPHDGWPIQRNSGIIDVVGLVENGAKPQALDRLEELLSARLFAHKLSCGFGAKRNHKNQNDRPEEELKQNRSCCVEGRGVKLASRAARRPRRQKHDRANKSALFLHAFLEEADR
jgi:hypothetical protein